MLLKDALRIENPVHLALVGAGGKSTTLFTLARQLKPPVLVTASTHLAKSEMLKADQCLIVNSLKEIRDLETMRLPDVLLLIGENVEEQRSAGLTRDQLEALFDFACRKNLHLLLEADGSKRLPVKAPADHEPAVPQWVDAVTVCVGLSCLGKPVTDEYVFRQGIFSDLSGAVLGERMTIDHLAGMLNHSLGGLKNIPDHARKIAFLNQADSDELKAAAEALAAKLTNHYDAVLVNSYHQNGVEKVGSVSAVYEKTAGIVLGGGEAKRFGEPKALLKWKDQALIRHVVEKAVSSGLDPVIVVVGAVQDPIREVLAGMPVQIVFNPHWEEGQSTSVIAGVNALSENIQSAILLMADQPQVPEELLKRLVISHSKNLASITATYISGHPSSPVLLDRKVFPDLQNLTGDVGARALFGKWNVQYVNWEKEEDLFDIDTPEDYQRLLKGKSEG